VLIVVGLLLPQHDLIPLHHYGHIRVCLLPSNPSSGRLQDVQILCDTFWSSKTLPHMAPSSTVGNPQVNHCLL